jgi:hypothetical protein
MKISHDFFRAICGVDWTLSVNVITQYNESVGNADITSRGGGNKIEQKKK